MYISYIWIENSSKNIVSLSCKCEIPKSMKNYSVHIATQWCAISYNDANKNTTLLLIYSSCGIWHFCSAKHLKCISNSRDFFPEPSEFGETTLDLFGESAMIDCNVCTTYNEIKNFRGNSKCKQVAERTTLSTL